MTFINPILVGRHGLPLSKPTWTKGDKGRLHPLAILSQAYISILESRAWYSKLLVQSGLKEAEQSRTDPPLLKYRQRTILPQNRATHSKSQSQSLHSHPGGGYTSCLSLLLPKFSLYLFIILMSLNKSKWGIFCFSSSVQVTHLSLNTHRITMHLYGLYTKSLHRKRHSTVFTAALEWDGPVGITTLLHFTDGRNKQKSLKYRKPVRRW